MSPQNAAAARHVQTRIVIVDDHPIVRQGIAMVVSQEPDLMICGEAQGAADALEVIKQTRPGLAIVDLSLKDGDGLELIKDIRIRHPDVRVLVLSMRDESFYAERALRAGASGYIAKEEGAARVVRGIRKVMAGEIFVSERLAARLMSLWTGGKGPGRPAVTGLSDRELQVLELIGEGLPTRDIARRLYLSVKTIESHREHIKEKLKIDSAPALLQYAIRWVRSLKGLA